MKLLSVYTEYITTEVKKQISNRNSQQAIEVTN